MSSLDALIAEEQRWIRVSDDAYRLMREQAPGSEMGAKYAQTVTAANARIAELRKQVRNHPDHTYEGL